MSSPTLRELAAEVLRYSHRMGFEARRAARELASRVLASPAVESAPAASKIAAREEAMAAALAAITTSDAVVRAGSLLAEIDGDSGDVNEDQLNDLVACARAFMRYVDLVKDAAIVAGLPPSAPAASGWRREPPTVEEVRRCRWWWVRGGIPAEERVERLMLDAHERPCIGAGVYGYPLPLAHLSGREDMEWSPCPPPSATAADAGIVARVESSAGFSYEHADGTVERKVMGRGRFPDWPGAAVGQRVEVLVRLLDAEHAARRGG